MAMNVREWWTKFIETDRPGLVRLLLIGGLGVALLAFGNFGVPRPSPPSTNASTTPHLAETPLSQQEAMVSAQLTGILEAIPGVRQVSAAVTLTRSIQSQYVSSSGGGNGTSPVVVSNQNGESVVPLDQVGPAIGGVVIVSPSAANPLLRAEMAQAVETLLQIQPYQVLVLPTAPTP
ncbi:hypothetical protein TPY_3299 [Sulfobacillus acidophilus TPY]|nr:hypothetical protein TPY_3299 [Sulfobacillus acidophilus TPY]